MRLQTFRNLITQFSAANLKTAVQALRLKIKTKKREVFTMENIITTANAPTAETENTVVRLWVTAAAALETLATYYKTAERDISAYEEIMTLYRALNTLENVIENGGGETH